MIEFGQWLPDLADHRNPGATEAKNVVPVIDGFQQLKALQVSSSALNLYARGAVAALKNDDVAYNYVGSGSKLYQLVDGTWTDRSVGGGTYSVGATDYWEFAKWGEKIIAVGGTGVSPQIITMGGAAFAALGGTPPKARHIAVVRDFVVMGNQDESGTVYPNRIRWSGINDETNWTTNASKQSDYQDLQGRGGWINAIRGGEYGVIIQEHTVRRMDYIGPPVVFVIDETLPGIGTPAPNSVVQWGDRIFMLSQTGFIEIIEGRGRPQEIGAGKINKWFFDNIDMSHITRVVGALDRWHRRIMWVFPGTGNSSGTPNNGLIFDIDSGHWSRFEDEIEWIYDALGEAYTLDGLDSVSASIDALDESLDSRSWVGGAVQLMAFDETHKSGVFSGDAMTATLETKEQQLISGRRTLVSRARPEVDGASSVTIAAGTRDVQTESVSWGNAAGAERDGNHALRSEGRYHRFRATITGGFDKAQGITTVEVADAGGY